MRTLLTALALLWPFICHLTLASLNLVMPSDEVIRLLGVNDRRGGSGGVWELAYIRDGVVNKNAAQFRIPVPEDVNAIQLVWWSGDSLQFNAGKSSRKLRVRKILITYVLLMYTQFLLIGTQLLSLEKIGNSSLFGGKFKGQNSLFLAFLWVFMQWNHRILPKRYISVSFLDKNKGQVLV